MRTLSVYVILAILPAMDAAEAEAWRPEPLNRKLVQELAVVPIAHDPRQKWRVNDFACLNEVGPGFRCGVVVNSDDDGALLRLQTRTNLKPMGWRRAIPYYAMARGPSSAPALLPDVQIEREVEFADFNEASSVRWQAAVGPSHLAYEQTGESRREFGGLRFSGGIDYMPGPTSGGISFAADAISFGKGNESARRLNIDAYVKHLLNRPLSSWQFRLGLGARYRAVHSASSRYGISNLVGPEALSDLEFPLLGGRISLSLMVSPILEELSLSDVNYELGGGLKFEVPVSRTLSTLAGVELSHLRFERADSKVRWLAGSLVLGFIWR